MTDKSSPYYLKKHPVIPPELLRELVFKLAKNDWRIWRDMDALTKQRLGGLGASLFKTARLNHEREELLLYLKKMFTTTDNYDCSLVDLINRILSLREDD